MGNRTRKSAAFLTRLAGNSAKGTFQFLRNTGRSIRAGVRDGINEIDDIELYDAPKPQATRKKK